MEERFESIFDINVAVGTKDELLMLCSGLIGRGGAISTVNPEILYDSLTNGELKTALSESLCIPDGAGVEAVLRRRGFRCERFPGVELAEALLDIKDGVKLGIIGGAKGIAECAMQNLVLRHGGVIPEFAISGYDIDEPSFVARLSDTRPDILFVCLGSPKQELFIKKMKRYSPGTLFLALGGSVDIYAGIKHRAPAALRAVRLEWAWRMLSEPKRFFRLPKLLGFFKQITKNKVLYGKIGKKVH